MSLSTATPTTTSRYVTGTGSSAHKRGTVVMKKVAGEKNPTNSLSKYTKHEEYTRDMLFLANSPPEHVGMYAKE